MFPGPAEAESPNGGAGSGPLWTGGGTPPPRRGDPPPDTRSRGVHAGGSAHGPAGPAAPLGPAASSSGPAGGAARQTAPGDEWLGQVSKGQELRALLTGAPRGSGAAGSAGARRSPPPRVRAVALGTETGAGSGGCPAVSRLAKDSPSEGLGCPLFGPPASLPTHCCTHAALRAPRPSIHPPGRCGQRELGGGGAGV